MARLLVPIAAVACLLVAGGAMAGPTGFAFLEVPAGARAAALGGAYVSLAEGVDGAFWNPAALALVRGTQVTGSHMESFQSLKHDQFAVAGQLFGGGLATSLRAMYTQPIDQLDDVGNVTGSWGAHDLEFQLGYGRALGARAQVGLAAQVVRERIANEAATTWSGSAGAAWSPARWRNVRLGAAVQHVGPAAYYTIDGQRGAPVDLPAALQAGGSWTRALPHGMGLTAALDARATRGRQAVVALGSELAVAGGAALRASVRQGDDVANFGAGMGWRRGTFSVDYAWVPSRLDLGDTHRFSFGAQF